MRIYLDNCCLSRLFDTQSNVRIKFETIAIETIFEEFEKGSAYWISSETLRYEALATKSFEKRAKFAALIERASHKINTTGDIANAAKKLMILGIKSYDALHLASAIAGKADVFLTVDDKLLNKTDDIKSTFGLIVMNPVDWVRQHLGDQNENT